jgi:hypothetical protein
MAPASGDANGLSKAERIAAATVTEGLVVADAALVGDQLGEAGGGEAAEREPQALALVVDEAGGGEPIDGGGEEVGRRRNDGEQEAQRDGLGASTISLFVHREVATEVTAGERVDGAEHGVVEVAVEHAGTHTPSAEQGASILRRFLVSG